MAGLTISIVADVAKAIKGLDQVSEKAGGFARGMQGVAGAVGGVLSFGAASKWANEWMGAAKQANKATKSLGIVFGDSAGVITQWASTSANAIGLTQTQAERYAITLGNQLEGYGVSQKAAAEGSVELTKRAADMAYVLGTDVGSVLDALGSSLKGRTGGLKSLGVNIDSNTIKERLAAKGLGKLSGEQATAAQASEILAMVLEKTGNMAGVLSSKTDATATSLPALKASIEDTKVSLGEALLPVMNAILPVLNSFAQWAERHPGLMQAVAVSILALAVAVGVFSVAMTALSIAGAPVWAIVIGITLGVVALTAAVIVIIKHWSTLVGWFKTAWQWLSQLISSHAALAVVIGGPVAAAILVISHFAEIWHGVQVAINAVRSAIEAVISVVGRLESVWHGILAVVNQVVGVVEKVVAAGQKVAGVVDKIKSAPAEAWHAITPWSSGAYYAPSGPGATAAGGGGGASVVVNIAGDVADPVILGRRIVAALDAYTSANGRRRLAELVNGSGGPAVVRA